MPSTTTDPAARYGLLASAIAGRALAVTGGSTDRCWSDGTTVHVPDDADYPLRDAVVVQAALVAAGALRPGLVAKTIGRASLRQRYLTLETLRATDQLSATVPLAVARRVAAVYAGAPPGSPEESLDRAGSREEIPEAPPWFGRIRPSKVVANASNVPSSAPTQDQIRQLGTDDELAEFDDEEETETSTLMKLLSSPIFKNPFSDALQRNFFQAGRSPSPDEGSPGEYLAAGGSRLGKVGRNAVVVDSPTGLADREHPPPRGRMYPEWDHRAEVYKPNHCGVTEYDPRPGDGVLDQGEDLVLRLELARLGLGYERHRRQPEGDGLDMMAVVDHVVDQAAGAAGDDRVYELRRRTARDLGVIVLLDVSGSTGDSSEAVRVHDEQREIAALLISTLDELGDRVAGFGFQSWGRDSVRFLRIKGFDDPYDVRARRRLASMDPDGFTRLGAAIRHGTHLVKQCSGATNKLLIVVGDGLPYDDGYERRYAQEDSRRALTDAVHEGVGCACVTVRSSTDDETLQRVWGHVPHIRIERPSEIAREVLPLVRRGLRDAVAMGSDGRRGR